MIQPNWVAPGMDQQRASRHRGRQQALSTAIKRRIQRTGTGSHYFRTHTMPLSEMELRAETLLAKLARLELPACLMATTTGVARESVWRRMTLRAARAEMICCSRSSRQSHYTIGIAEGGNCATIQIDKPTDGIACWWEEIKISTHLRLAASVCVLTTGLFIGSAGGAIAAADTESTDSSTQSQGADDSNQSVSSARSPTGSSAATAGVATTHGQATRPTLPDLIRKLQLLGMPQQRPAADKPTTTVAADATTQAVTHTDKTEGSDVTPATTDPVASDSNLVAADSNVTAPVTDVVASNSNVPGSSTNLVTPALKSVEPVTNAVVKVATVVQAVPGLVLSLPTSTTPIADVIAWVQYMLTSVNDAIAALAQMPNDLYSLLGVAAANAAVIEAGANDAAGLSAAAGLTLARPTLPMPPLSLPISGTAAVPSLGNVTAPAMLGGIAAAGLSQDLSLSGTAPLAPAAVGPTGALSYLEHTIRAVLAPASLSALAALALPGVGGLLIVCAAGVRVGYRQAKVAFAVRSTGIARFARQGPIGVVRSGSLIALHSRSSVDRRSRSLRVVGPHASRTAPLFEQVA